MGGGDWELLRSAIGSAGEPSLASGEFQCIQSIGEPFGTLASMTGAQDRFESGYLSSVLFEFASPRVRAFSAQGSVQHQGVALGVGPALPVRVEFTGEMSSGTLASAVSVWALRDQMAGPVSFPWTASLLYSSMTQTAELYPAGTWPKGHLFQVRIATQALDLNGQPLSEPATHYFLSVRDYTVDNVAAVLSEPQSRANIPAGAFGQDYSLAVSTFSESEAVRSANVKLSAALGPDREPVKLLSVEPYDGQGTKWEGTLAKQATLDLPYDPAQLSVPAKTLNFWRLDDASQLWVRQHNSSVDEASKQVSIPVRHFSTYALIGQQDTDVSNVIAMPVPFRPNAGDPARYGCWSGCSNPGIRFTSVPPQGSLRIYTISGEKVLDVPLSANPQVWDARNSGGERVASGLYIWEVVSGENRKTGKLVVIK